MEGFACSDVSLFEICCVCYVMLYIYDTHTPHVLIFTCLANSLITSSHSKNLETEVVSRGSRKLKRKGRGR